MEHEYKGYRIAPDFASLVKILQSGKGMVPTVLRGSYTNRSVAMQAIDDYLSEKGVKDGKTDSNS